MSNIKTLTIASLLIAATVSAPAFASSQDDVAACRAATTAQSPAALDGYRLRFVSSKGHKNRILEVTAIPTLKSAGERFNITCRLNRSDTVLAVYSNKTTLLAQKK